jgi:hypothetical protein
LDAIGFEWNVLEAEWEDALAALKTFIAREGHCRVLQNHVEGGFNLGKWVHRQRRKKSTMGIERSQRLDAVGFIWDPHEATWEEGFAALKTFKAREGHCRVPALQIEGAYTLGSWVHNQRRRKNSISAERKERLDAIGFEWNQREVEWEDALATLKTFIAREGHCRVPQNHVEGGFKLENWVNRQRNKKSTMGIERRQQLDAVGFIWDPYEATWEEGFAALKTFKAREGDCRVPQSHVEGTFVLGKWVSNQRIKKESMSAERKQRLDAIEFLWRLR